MIKLSGDIGNGNLKLGISLNGDFFGLYQQNLGIKKTLRELVEKTRQMYGDLTINAMSFTGAGRHHLKWIFPFATVKTEILCQYRAITSLYPHANSIIEIGKEDSKVITLRDKVIDYFLMNTLCGGGAGAYIETVCFRFNLGLAEFDNLALQAEKPVNISSKCSVLGMSSALSYLQRGEETKNIVAGIVRAVARNILSMVKGKQIKPPCVFTGGGALLKSLKKAFEEELGFEVTVPVSPIFTGAYGASLYAQENKNLTLKQMISVL